MPGQSEQFLIFAAKNKGLHTYTIKFRNRRTTTTKTLPKRSHREWGRWLHVSGQAGLFSNGFLAGEAEAQIEKRWTNVLANLKDADINPDNLVKVTKYVTDEALALL